jgi:hypothetical protein
MLKKLLKPLSSGCVMLRGGSCRQEAAAYTAAVAISWGLYTRLIWVYALQIQHQERNISEAVHSLVHSLRVAAAGRYQWRAGGEERDADHCM